MGFLVIQGKYFFWSVYKAVILREKMFESQKIQKSERRIFLRKLMKKIVNSFLRLCWPKSLENNSKKNYIEKILSFSIFIS